MVRGSERNETVDVDPPLTDAFGEKDRQPRLDAWNAVWNPAKTLFSLRIELAFFVIEAEWAVVRREQIEHPSPSLPNRRLGSPHRMAEGSRRTLLHQGLKGRGRLP